MTDGSDALRIRWGLGALLLMAGIKGVAVIARHVKATGNGRAEPPPLCNTGGGKFSVLAMDQMLNDSGGKPSAVCPRCGRGNTAPHRVGCPFGG